MRTKKLCAQFFSDALLFLFWMPDQQKVNREESGLDLFYGLASAGIANREYENFLL
jgi:hypothetical protein